MKIKENILVNQYIQVWKAYLASNSVVCVELFCTFAKSMHLSQMCSTIPAELKINDPTYFHVYNYNSI